MRTPLALLVSAALLFPVTVLTAPAQAGTSAVTITNCAKTRHGVTVRIKIRDEGSRGRVRVSHPRGDGNFREPRVRWVHAGMVWSGEPSPPNPDGGEVGTGVSLRNFGDRPSFRAAMPSYGTTQAFSTFKLRNGKSIHLTCTAR